MYREHRGPVNIPKREMWELHTDLSETPYDLKALAERSEDEVIYKMFGTVCYPEHGLPLLLFQAAKHDFSPESALLANANAGGDCVHRGAILGLITGAANDYFPSHLREGLADGEAIEKEIEGFVKIAEKNNPW